MLHAPKVKAKRNAQRTVRFKGIGADAKALNVHRTTLYRVLTGEWANLKTLRARYYQLKAQQAEAAIK